MLESWWQDARYALRALGRSPLFTVVAVLSLAIGVGATTAVFALADALLLESPAGVGAPERLVDVGSTRDGEGFDNFSYPVYRDYRDGTRALSGLAALRISPETYSLGLAGGVAPVQGTPVSGNYFAVLQARPALGRFFLPEEDRTPGGAAVTVVSHRFWQERLGGDPDVVGSMVRLNGTPFTVVGVTEPAFRGSTLTAPELWVPLTSTALLGAPADHFEHRGAVWLVAIGRLAPGATLDEAQAELGAVAQRLRVDYPDVNQRHGVRVLPAGLLPGEMRAPVRGFMALLFAAAGLVLVIASTNVAGMLLARGAARGREVAVRLAVGASRRRLVRQLATESVLLFLVAGAAGVLVARLMTALLLGLLPRLPFTLNLDPSVDWRVLAFALGTALVAGLLAGLAPALRSTRPSLVPALKGAAGGERWGRLRLRSGLVVAQLALSLLLLVGAGLFLRAMAHARAIDPGFDARGVELTSLDLGLADLSDDEGLRVAEELVARATALPGVAEAALALQLPLDGGGFGLGGVRVEGRRPSPDRDSFDADWNVVSPGYLALMRTPLVAGRDFTAADRAGTPDVAIINETLAGQLWPGQSAVGRTFHNDERVVTVVGVARDAKYRTLGERPRGFVYVPIAQRYMGRTSLLVRVADGAPSPAPAVRRLVAQVHPALPVLDQQSLAQYTSITLFPQRIALRVAGSLGVVALLLAVLGIYGVTAYAVTRRARELGIRVALGAQRGSVLRLVLRQGALLAAVGTGVGLLAAAAATRVLAGLLYGVPPLDPVTYAGAAALLVGAALVASWLPARRAAGADPMVVLRGE